MKKNEYMDSIELMVEDICCKHCVISQYQECSMCETYANLKKMLIDQNIIKELGEKK